MNGSETTNWVVCIGILATVFLVMKFFVLIMRLPGLYYARWPDRWEECRDPHTFLFRGSIDKAAEILTKENKWGKVYSRFNKSLNEAELFSEGSNTVLARIRAHESISVFKDYDVPIEYNQSLSKENMNMIYRAVSYEHGIRFRPKEVRVGAYFRSAFS